MPDTRQEPLPLLSFEPSGVCGDVAVWQTVYKKKFLRCQLFFRTEPVRL